MERERRGMVEKWKNGESVKPNIPLFHYSWVSELRLRCSAVNKVLTKPNFIGGG
jgi:hypothetical protein